MPTMPLTCLDDPTRGPGEQVAKASGRWQAVGMRNTAITQSVPAFCESLVLPEIKPDSRLSGEGAPCRAWGSPRVPAPPRGTAALPIPFRRQWS
jgi:hypothetical protein